MPVSPFPPLSPAELSSQWIVCQLGAREHYAIPRSLHQSNQLHALITDAWTPPQSFIHRFPGESVQAIRDRFHPDLTQAPVHSLTSASIQFELRQRLRRSSGWNRITSRNQWFQRQCLAHLKKLAPHFSQPPVLFSYSYTALELLKFAKSEGWHTVLGQIDPGIVEQEIVEKLHDQLSGNQSTWQPAPSQYWNRWQEECSLAERILVNSNWSSEALQKAGIPVEKLATVPLAYEAPTASKNFTRTYPKVFSSQRPLRVLFLGQAILRKGILPLLAAAELLASKPIEFHIVGAPGVALTPAQKELKNVRWVGPVSRSATSQYYQQADVFLFPTFSDGFGLTQLEAQAWKLPIISSHYCGDVVQSNLNGLLLPTVSGSEIAKCLERCLQNPERLLQFSTQSIHLSDFSLSQLSNRLS